jgi:nitroreductase
MEKRDTHHSLFRNRFSCRAYTADPVSREIISGLVEAARWAPNGGNLQPWRFVVVMDAELRGALAAAAYGQSFLATAPVVIAVCAVPEESARHYGERGRELYCLQDTAAATQNLLLAATEQGLGSCWVGAFDELRVAESLDLPVGWRPVALVAIGYPAEEEGRRSRRTLEAVTVWKG